MSYNRWRCTENIAVYVDVDDVLDQISFNKIEEEYERLLELRENDRSAFDIDEKYNRNDSQVEIEVDPDEFDLVSQNDVSIDDFELNEIIDAVENSGYTVVRNTYDAWSDYGIANYLNDLPKWKLRGILCDLLGVNHLVSNEEIINGLKEKIK